MVIWLHCSGFIVNIYCSSFPCVLLVYIRVYFYSFFVTCIRILLFVYFYFYSHLHVSRVNPDPEKWFAVTFLKQSAIIFEAIYDLRSGLNKMRDDRVECCTFLPKILTDECHQSLWLDSTEFPGRCNWSLFMPWRKSIASSSCQWDCQIRENLREGNRFFAVPFGTPKFWFCGCCVVETKYATPTKKFTRPGKCLDLFTTNNRCVR